MELTINTLSMVMRLSRHPLVTKIANRVPM
jgi:hypothetical protein